MFFLSVLLILMNNLVNCRLPVKKSIFVTKGGGNGGGRFWPIIDEIKAGPLTNYTLLPYFCGPNNYFGPHFYKQSISPPRTNPIKCVSLFLGTTLIPSRMKVSTREISSI